MSILKSLFSEESGISMMRVMAFMSLVMAGYLAFIGKNDCVDIFVIAAFGGKAGQKLIETKKATSDK